MEAAAVAGLHIAADPIEVLAVAVETVAEVVAVGLVDPAVAEIVAAGGAVDNRQDLNQHRTLAGPVQAPGRKVVHTAVMDRVTDNLLGHQRAGIDVKVPVEAHHRRWGSSHTWNQC